MQKVTAIENRNENNYKNQLAAKTAEFENQANQLAILMREKKALESRMSALISPMCVQFAQIAVDSNSASLYGGNCMVSLQHINATVDSIHHNYGRYCIGTIR